MAESLMGPATGLTNSKLAKASAIAAKVVKGETFYAGDKNIKTGTMPNRALSPQAGGQADTYLNDQFKNVGVSTDSTASYWLCKNGDGVKRFCIRPPYGAYALGADQSVLGTTDGYCGFPASKLGNAFSNHVLSGMKFSSENGINTAGSMTNNGNVYRTLNPGESMNIANGYHAGSGTITARGLTANDILGRVKVANGHLNDRVENRYILGIIYTDLRRYPGDGTSETGEWWNIGVSEDHHSFTGSGNAGNVFITYMYIDV